MADKVRIYAAPYSIKNLGAPQHSEGYKLCNFICLVLEVDELMSIDLHPPIKIKGSSIQILADQSSIGYANHIKLIKQIILIKQNDTESGTEIVELQIPGGTGLLSPSAPNWKKKIIHYLINKVNKWENIHGGTDVLGPWAPNWIKEIILYLPNKIIKWKNAYSGWFVYAVPPKPKVFPGSNVIGWTTSHKDAEGYWHYASPVCK